MSDLRQAAQKALDALLTVRNNSSVSMHQLALISPAIEACRAALAKPDVPETNFGNMSDTLPPLPYAQNLRFLQAGIDPGPPYIVTGYTADQMRAYAAASIASDRDAWANAFEDLCEKTLSAQSGPESNLSNVMLRQLARLGFGECAAAIRSAGRQA